MKVVVSDVGGVLAQDSYNELLDRLLLKPIETSTYITETSVFNSIMACANKCWGEYKVGNGTEESFFGTIVNQSQLLEELAKRGYNVEVTDAVSWLKNELRVHHMQLYEPVVDLFYELRNRYNSPDIVFAVLSNHTIEWLPFIFDQSAEKLYATFPRQFIYNSAEIRLAKPDIKAFEHVMSDISSKLNTNLQQLQYLFIDDKLANIEASRRAGMEGYVYHAGKMPVSELKNELESFLNNRQ